MDRRHIPYTISDPKFQPSSFVLETETPAWADDFNSELNRMARRYANAAEVEAAHRLVGLILEKLGGELILTRDELEHFEKAHYTFRQEYLESIDSFKLVAERAPDE